MSSLQCVSVRPVMRAAGCWYTLLRCLTPQPSSIEVGFCEGSTVEVENFERKGRPCRSTGANEKKPPRVPRARKSRAPEGFRRRGCRFATADCNLGSAEACSKKRQDFSPISKALQSGRLVTVTRLHIYRQSPLPGSRYVLTKGQRLRSHVSLSTCVHSSVSDEPWRQTVTDPSRFL